MSRSEDMFQITADQFERSVSTSGSLSDQTRDSDDDSQCEENINETRKYQGLCGSKRLHLSDQAIQFAALHPIRYSESLCGEQELLGSCHSYNGLKILKSLQDHVRESGTGGVRVTSQLHRQVMLASLNDLNDIKNYRLSLAQVLSYNFELDSVMDPVVRDIISYFNERYIKLGRNCGPKVTYKSRYSDSVLAEYNMCALYDIFTNAERKADFIKTVDQECYDFKKLMSGDYKAQWFWPLTSIQREIHNQFTAVLEAVFTKTNSVIINATVQPLITELSTQFSKMIKEWQLDKAFAAFFIALGTSIILYMFDFPVREMTTYALRGVACVKILQSCFAQDSEDVVSFLINLLHQTTSYVFSKKMSDKLRSLLVWNSVFTGKSSVFMRVVNVLPVFMKVFIDNHICSINKLPEGYGDWYNSTNVLLMMSKTPHVICNADFEKMLMVNIETGMTLSTKMRDSHEYTQLIRRLTELINLASNVINMTNINLARMEPYCFSVYGDPGIGKTTLVHQLLRDSFGFSWKDFYHRQPFESFWNGFNPLSKVVIYDEYCSNVNLDVGSESLALVSSAPYQPLLASVDNPSVGVKGTSANPEVVVKISNVPFPKDNSIRASNLNAHHRRRKFNIEIKVKDDWVNKTFDGKPLCQKVDGVISNVQFELLTKHLTSEQLEKKVWLEFILRPVLPVNDFMAHGTVLSFEQLVDMLRFGLEEQKRVYRTLVKPTDRSALEDVDKMYERLLSVIGTGKEECVRTSYTADATSFMRSMYNTMYEAGVKTSGDIKAVMEPVVMTGQNVLSTLIPKTVNSLYAGYTLGSVVNRLAVFSAVLATAHDIYQYFVNKNVSSQSRPKSKTPHKAYKVNRSYNCQNRALLQSQSVPPKICQYSYVQFPGMNRARVIPIKDRIILMCAHMLREADGNFFEEGTPFQFFRTKDSEPVTIKFKTANLVYDLGADQAFYLLDEKRVQQFKDITNKFVSVDEVGFLNRFQGALYLDETEPELSEATLDSLDYQYCEQRINVEHGFKYPIRTVYGDCSSVLVSATGSSKGKIVGIHVAGRRFSTGGKLGCATLVTNEDIHEACSNFALAAQSENFTNSKLELEPEEAVYRSTKTKLAWTEISEIFYDCVEGSIKQPAILSQYDSRAGGRCPYEAHYESIIGLGIKPECADPSLQVAADMVLHYYSELLPKYAMNRTKFTISQVLNGVPGYFSGLDMSTSPGLPTLNFSRAAGKHAVVKVKEGVRILTSLGEQLCEKQLIKFKNKDYTHGFLAFTKDECVSIEKIANVRTRIIYCGNLISYILLKQTFGPVIAAFNSTKGECSACLGINPSSYDLNKVYTYLNEIRVSGYLAGDYKDYDKRVHPTVQRMAYKIICELTKLLVEDYDQYAIDALYDHEVNAYAIFPHFKTKFQAMHFSGCMFTTIVNSIINQIMVYYSFMKICPELNLNDNLRMVSHGDDVIIAVSQKAAKKFNNLTLHDELAKLGQVYTSDVKNEELTADFKSFKEVTFLGVRPRLLAGRWVGSYKIEVLIKPLMISKKSMNVIDCLHETYYYSTMLDDEQRCKFREAYVRACAHFNIVPVTDVPKYYQTIVANRTSETNEDYFGYVAQSDRPLTVVDAPTGFKKSERDNPNIKDFEDSVGIQHYTNEFSMDSFVYRNTFEWKASDVAGSEIQSIGAPFDLLSKGNTTNIQNYETDKWFFIRTDVELLININGTQFQQGLLACAAIPVLNQDVGIARALSLDHVKITPGGSSYTIKFPYVYNTSSLLNLSSSQNDFVFFKFVVISPLTSTTENDVVNVSVWSRFPNCKFFGPKNPEITAQSGFFSDILGAVPKMIGAAAQGLFGGSDNTQTKMDNTPMNGGSMPVYNQYSSISKSNGNYGTSLMSLHPGSQSRGYPGIFGDDQPITSFQHICMRESYLETVTISLTDQTGDILTNIPLIQPLIKAGVDRGTQVNFTAQIADLFQYWRSDFIFNFYAIKTPFHSFKARATVGYGSPGTATSSQSTSFYNTVMDFSRENSLASIHIPYAGFLPYLRTYDGSRDQERSMGYLSLIIVNKLIAPDTVSDSVDIMVTYRLIKPQFAIPRPIGVVFGFETATTYKDAGVVSDPEEEVVAQSCPNMIYNGALPLSNENVHNQELTSIISNVSNDAARSLVTGGQPFNQAGDNTDQVAAPIVAGTSTGGVEIVPTRNVDEQPVVTSIGTGGVDLTNGEVEVRYGSFEYNPTFVQDVYRRGLFVTRVGVFQRSQTFLGYGQAIPGVNTFDHYYPVRWGFNGYAGWRGTTRFRLFINSAVNGQYKVSFIPALGLDYSIFKFDSTACTGSTSLRTEATYQQFYYSEEQSKRALRITRQSEDDTFQPLGPIVPVATEVAYKVGGDQQYLDFSIPFSINRHFCFSGNTMGTLCITVNIPVPNPPGPPNFNDLQTSSIYLYQSMGDDFELGPFIGNNTYYEPPRLQYPDSGTESGFVDFLPGGLLGYKLDNPS